MIVQFKGAAVDCVYVPSMINDCPVTRICSAAFSPMNWNRKLVYEDVEMRYNIQRIILPETVKKIENSNLFKNPKKIERIMALLFFIPGTPKDLLTYIAGLLPIKMSRFLVISTLARIPSVISSTLAGASIMNGSWKHAIIMYGGIFLVVLIIMAIYSLFNKDDDTKEALKTIK